MYIFYKIPFASGEDKKKEDSAGGKDGGSGRKQSFIW